MQIIALSEAALDLFRLHVKRRGDVMVDDSNREVYRELARAGLVSERTVVIPGLAASKPPSATRSARAGVEPSRTNAANAAELMTDRMDKSPGCSARNADAGIREKGIPYD